MDELIGSCPKCGVMLVSDDINDIKFHAARNIHHAYVCRKCGTIIGFSLD